MLHFSPHQPVEYLERDVAEEVGEDHDGERCIHAASLEDGDGRVERL